ncbi:hypothetical protein HGM15179_007222 [Zosterops borbonicus]|uniref:Uncharacterized protein n=1 Tax=Zosterops borbonicus TaxID=364589 RepID=A0A8K1LMM8_9PASS|nr:hypothetical protein HGM15179_007222 [Zosterops borbonicus]
MMLHFCRYRQNSIIRGMTRKAAAVMVFPKDHVCSRDKSFETSCLNHTCGHVLTALAAQPGTLLGSIIPDTQQSDLAAGEYGEQIGYKQFDTGWKYPQGSNTQPLSVRVP